MMPDAHVASDVTPAIHDMLPRMSRYASPAAACVYAWEYYFWAPTRDRTRP